jgi:hypothetical protein
MQKVILFAIQNLFFDLLKNALCEIKVLKICGEKPKEKFVLIESIRESFLTSGRRQFDIVLHIFPQTFDYKVLSRIIDEVKNALTQESLKTIDGFVNFKQMTSFISSSLEKGYEAKLEFALFTAEV